MSARAKSRARICRGFTVLGVLLAATLAAPGCTPPAVAGRAVWVGSDRARDGSRTLYSYGAGTITTSALRPASVDDEAEALPLLVELGPRGRGALVRAVDNGWLHELGEAGGLHAGYVDLTRSRALALWLPNDLDSAGFAASGDALLWLESCPQTLAVLPLAAGVPLGHEAHGETTTLAPLRRGIGSDGTGKPAFRACGGGEAEHAVVAAADAPVVFVLEARLQDTDLRVREAAAIEALRYPATAEDPAQLAIVARGSLPAEHIPLRLPSLRCPGGSCGVVAVDPDGAAVSVAVYGGDCRLLRFEVATGETRCAVTQDAPFELQSERLVAAISAEHYVYRQGLTIYRYSWRTGEVASRLLPGEASELFSQVTTDGRVVVVGTTSGAAMRVDRETIELLNVAQQLCENPQPPIVSPAGSYLAWTCAAEPTFFGGNSGSAPVGDVMRVSVGGLERYQGVPMWALAIDDEGDLLLHSRRSQAFNYELQLPASAPRNLYVLSADGELARIDGLEPEPELMIGLGAGTYRWMAGAAL